MHWLRVCVLVVMLSLALSLVGVAAYQDTKKGEDPPAVKLKGTLPTYFKSLGLRDDQIQKIYKISADYGAKIADLEGQIKKLKAERDDAREKVLTAEQKKRLDELRLKKQ